MSAEKSANCRQVGGNHYKSDIQHWDFVVANELDYFQGQITKYVTRWKSKNGIADLEKAKHFLEKYLEVETNKLRAKTPIGVTYATPPLPADHRLVEKWRLLQQAPLPPKVTKVVLDPFRRETGQMNPFGFDAAKDI